jgi:hypothetical protein
VRNPTDLQNRAAGPASSIEKNVFTAAMAVKDIRGGRWVERSI